MTNSKWNLYIFLCNIRPCNYSSEVTLSHWATGRVELHNKIYTSGSHFQKDQ